MKKVIYFLTLTLATSCSLSVKSDDEILGELKSPVILIGLDKGYEIVSVLDSNGRCETFSNSGLAVTLSKSRSVGDTIK